MKKFLIATAAVAMLLGSAAGYIGSAYALSDAEVKAEAERDAAQARADKAAEQMRVMQQLKEQAEADKWELKRQEAEEARRAGENIE